jgi:hypothetical protein
MGRQMIKTKRHWSLISTIVSAVIAITVSLVALVHSNEVQKIAECRRTADSAKEIATHNGTEIAVIKTALDGLEQRLDRIEQKQDKQSDVSEEILRIVRGRP